MMNLLELAMLKKMAGGGNNTGGGLSIKEITFTDRPTLYAWLQNNFDKIVKCNMSSAQDEKPINFCVWSYHNGDGSYSFDGLTLNGGSLTFTKKKVAIGSNEVRIEYQFIDNDIETNVIPDEYWAAVGAAITIYYIE